MQPNWKEQLRKKIWAAFNPNKGLDLDIVSDFISTEIIEKLIADIPDWQQPGNKMDGVDNTDFKQQLRDKWL